MESRSRKVFMLGKHGIITFGFNFSFILKSEPKRHCRYKTKILTKKMSLPREEDEAVELEPTCTDGIGVAEAITCLKMEGDTDNREMYRQQNKRKHRTREGFGTRQKRADRECAKPSRYRARCHVQWRQRH